MSATQRGLRVTNTTGSAVLPITARTQQELDLVRRRLEKQSLTYTVTGTGPFTVTPGARRTSA